MDRKFLYGRGGPPNAHEQAVNTTFNDNPYSIELDRLEVFEIGPDNPYMLSVLATKKSLLEDAKHVRRILNRDTFHAERSKKSDKSQNKNEDDDDYFDTGEDVVIGEEETEEDGENKKDKDEHNSSSEEEDLDAEDDLDVDNDYMENHFDNGEGYISDD